MSITALVTGKLIADPERRTGASGKPFTLARLVARDGDVEAMVSLIAFGSLADQLGALGKGDTAAVTGRAKVNTWTGRDGAAKTGLSVTVDGLLTAYHVRRKRQALAGDLARPGATPEPKAAQAGDFDHGADDWLDGSTP